MLRFLLALTVLALISTGSQSAAASTTTAAAVSFIDDADDDNDGVLDIAEPACGGNATNPNLRPERVDDVFAGKDDDGDTLVDEALPGGSADFDCDGDGYKGSAEDHVFSYLPQTNGDQKTCADYDAAFPNATHKPSKRWPADLDGSAFSLNKINISDLSAFTNPIRYLNQDVGTDPMDIRFDLVPGTTVGTDINIADLATITSGTTGFPQMLVGTRAFGGRVCPWPIPAGGYELAAPITAATYNQMTEFAMIPGSNDEAVVALQGDERIWRISLTNAFTPTLYGDLSAYIISGGEQGLLSVAFSPDFQNDHRIYAYYTRGSPNPTILARFQVVGNAMDTTVETVVISIPDFANNHNGGRIAFGLDGYLYLSLGDGGGGGDPNENGQNINTLLGKVLRLNVTGQATYTSPPGNPYVGVAGADEIFALGFRNPWRMSIDSFTGDVWLGDVGQGTWEEVDRVVNGGNYGWDCYEGPDPYEAAGCGPIGNYRFPREEYPNPGGSGGAPAAVSGGFVYRGPSMPELNGYYIYADFYDGRIWAVNTLDSSAAILLVDTPYNISSFAELPDGDLLVLTFNNAI
jgi:glucose/arabinose dehydrogenase